MVYPKKIANQLANLPQVRSSNAVNAVGTGANFGCGSFVRFSLEISVEGSRILDVTFRSNGCGYMVSAASLLAESQTNRLLTDLHGLTDIELSAKIANRIGEVPSGRTDCINVCFQALHAALANFRTLRIEEFAGEKALICTCFGVTEERIEEIIRGGTVESAEDVSAVCNAGLGCGSCRMMIEEMIDERPDQP